MLPDKWHRKSKGLNVAITYVTQSCKQMQVTVHDDSSQMKWQDDHVSMTTQCPCSRVQADIIAGVKCHCPSQSRSQEIQMILHFCL